MFFCLGGGLDNTVKPLCRTTVFLKKKYYLNLFSFFLNPCLFRFFLNLACFYLNICKINILKEV